MGNPEKLMAQIFDLKFTSKSLQWQARKCEKEEKEQKLKVKNAIEKGNVDGTRIYAEKAGGSALGLPYAHGLTSAFLIRRSRGSMAAFMEEERAVDDHLGHPP